MLNQINLQQIWKTEQGVFRQLSDPSH